MTEYTDNDGNPIGKRFYTDPEHPKRIYDATVQSYDQGDALEVVGWRAEGEAWRYANEIAAMLNEVEAMRRDAERYRKLRWASCCDNKRFIHAMSEAVPEGVANGSRSISIEEFDAMHDAAIASEKEATK